MTKTEAQMQDILALYGVGEIVNRDIFGDEIPERTLARNFASLVETGYLERVTNGEYRILKTTNNWLSLKMSDHKEKIGQDLAMTEFFVGSGLLTHLRKSPAYKEHRDCFDKLKDYLSSDFRGRVCTLYGLRRTGKSVLMTQAMLEMTPAQLAKTLYINVKSPLDSMMRLRATLDYFRDHGIEYCFIDEATLLEDFSLSWSSLADNYSMAGMKIVQAGTDSLLFDLVEEREGFDRMYMIHTTNITFAEFCRIMNTNDISDFIRFGGILADTRENRPISMVSKFANPTEAERYSNSAIATNIVHSLARDDISVNPKFNFLVNLYNRGHLVNFIQRRVHDFNNSNALNILTSNFSSNQLSLTVRNMKQSKRKDPVDQEKLIQTYENIIKSDVIKNFMRDFLILDIDFKKAKYVIGEAEREVVDDYLRQLGLLRHFKKILFTYKGVLDEKDTTFIVQPGLRFCQTQALVKEIVKQSSSMIPDVPMRKQICEQMLYAVSGKILEDIVVFESMQALAGHPEYEVFQFRWDKNGSEFDLVIHDTEEEVMTLVEVKNHDIFYENDAKHLCNMETINFLREKFPNVYIADRKVLYRGEDQFHENGVSWENVNSFLRNLNLEALRPQVRTEEENLSMMVSYKAFQYLNAEDQTATVVEKALELASKEEDSAEALATVIDAITDKEQHNDLIQRFSASSTTPTFNR